MRVAFTTLGCRLNLYETEAMRRRALDCAKVVDWKDEAELYVINSCTVTARAEQKCRQLARSVKRRHPSCRVMVVGCYSQVNGHRLMEVPEIDMALGNEEKKEIERYLERAVRGERLLEARSYPRRMKIHPDEWIVSMEGRSRAMIKVQEGCNLRCTFCSVWSARGPSRSRPPREVVRQARLLADAGYEEIVLGGVHLGHYGRDLDPATGLVPLLEMLLERVDSRVRFRLSSIDPSEVEMDLVEMLASEDRLCRYLHLPLQSGSDAVLRRMRRPYTRARYHELVEAIAAADSRFGLGVDLIAGFPGETEDDFEATVGLLEALPVAFYHVFPYSRRENTPAASMPDAVDGPTANRRAATLRELGRRKHKAFMLQQIGSITDGIVEGAAEKGREREIMLDNYATVRARADGAPAGRRVRVEICALDDEGNLKGRLVEP